MPVSISHGQTSTPMMHVMQTTRAATVRTYACRAAVRDPSHPCRPATATPRTGSEATAGRMPATGVVRRVKSRVAVPAAAQMRVPADG